MKKIAAPWVAGLALLAWASCKDEGVLYLTNVTEEAPGANCADGGSKLNFGADGDADGQLGSTEVTASAYVCNGAASRGATVTSSALQSGDPDCPSGGYVLSVGVDRNGNGAVDASEGGATRKICNGGSGAAGAAGPAGEGGPAGEDGAPGPQGDAGVAGPQGDQGVQGVTGETGTSGTPGTPGGNGFSSLMRLTPEPAGLTCVEDGLRVDVGLDNGDGEGVANDDDLDDDEIDQTSYVCARVGCGDSVVSAGETCDDGNEVTESCEYGAPSCSVCDSSCQVAAGATSLCGDSTVDASNGEGCDDGNTVTEACAYGNTSCSVCNETCQTVAGATSFCGDSTVDGSNSETCDDGNSTTETCTYGETGCDVCDATCASVAGAASFCGDSTVDASNGEDCDDGNATTESCTYGESTGCTVCNSTCVSAAGTVSFCGDSIVDASNGESCDDGGTADGDGCSSTCVAQQLVNSSFDDGLTGWTAEGFTIDNGDGSVHMAVHTSAILFQDIDLTGVTSVSVSVTWQDLGCDFGPVPFNLVIEPAGGGTALQTTTLATCDSVVTVALPSPSVVDISTVANQPVRIKLEMSNDHWHLNVLEVALSF